MWKDCYSVMLPTKEKVGCIIKTSNNVLVYQDNPYLIEDEELDFNNYGEESFYKTPEEAELACLKKLIEIVKEK